MIRIVPVVLVALLLGGCTEGLSGLGGSILTTIGGGVSESYAEKKAAIAEWKIIKRRLDIKYMVLLETEADRLIATPATRKEGLELLKLVMQEHADAQPLWLIQQYIRRGDE